VYVSKAQAAEAPVVISQPACVHRLRIRAFLRGSIGLKLNTLMVPTGGAFLGGFFVDTLVLLGTADTTL
jgi:hypothetical protein